MLTESLNELEDFLQNNGYSLHIYWHASRHEWQAMFRDASGENITDSYDTDMSTAIVAAMLRVIDAAP